ncbi:MAG TPA: hypothetical protein VNB90_01035 [Cytophagaceae bacterium]|nr:hypothetical protein [Cytophagaceae bacterium]
MNRSALFILLFSLVFLLTGCPYNSDIPLSETPNVAIDKALLGSWQLKEDVEKKDSSVLKIYSFNKTEYSIIVEDKSKAYTTVEAYRAFATTVEGVNLINLEKLDYKGKFNFFNYKIEGDILKIKIVSDVNVKDHYTSSKAMVKAFAEKMKEKEFFEGEIILVRKK